MNEDELREYGEKTNAMVMRVLEANPGLPLVTAHIIAGDLISAERATEALVGGMPPDRAVWLVGSYARWDWALTMVATGHLSEQWFQDHITELWSGSDPDDTNPKFLAIWRTARVRAGGIIRDGRPFPGSQTGRMTRIYRGGPPYGLADGFAWTTDPKVARKFANGAGVRVQMTDGVVISGLVSPRDVIAYITGRNEAEVIVDPRRVKNIKTGVLV